MTVSKHTGLGEVRRVYSFWGSHPGLYAAQDWITFMGRQRAIRRHAVEATGAGPGARVLEVACGTGRNFRYLEEHIGPRGQIVGVDFSGDMLAAARGLVRRHGWPNVLLIRGDAARLEVGLESFDAVVSVLGISAIPDYRACLKRCHEVLRPGGVLSVCDASLFSGAMRMVNPLVRAVYTRGAAWHPDRDITGEMHRIFGNVTRTSFNLGSCYVATSIRAGVAG